MTARARAIDALASMLEAPLAVRDDVAAADAVVVLGAPLRCEVLSDVGEERVRAALALWHRGVAPLVCVTGGVTRGAARSEADAMASALAIGGVPRDAIIIEPTAQHTAANARASAALLLPRGARRVVLVTHPFHARRARGLFAAAGLEPSVWHLEDSVQARDRARALRWLAREYAAIARGWLPGR